MNILAIDFGTARLGLAWCNTTLGMVLPYGLIEHKTVAGKIKALADLVTKEKIDRLVVGFPMGLNAKENKNTERVKNFVFELQKVIDIPADFFDERFSSQAADAVGAGVSRDEKSAMIILEGYLQKNKY